MIGGDAEQGWLILKNGDRVSGLFQGIFDRNTFNPGWDQNRQEFDTFTDGLDIYFEKKSFYFDEGSLPGLYRMNRSVAAELSYHW